MIAIEPIRPRGRTDVVMTMAVAILGSATVVSMGALLAHQQAVAIMAGGMAAAALLLLLADGALDPAAVLVVSLPFPALYAAGDLRLAPAAPLSALVIAAWFLGWGASGRRIESGRLPASAGIAFLSAYAFASIATPHRAAALRELVNTGVLAVLLVVITDFFTRRRDRANTVALVAAAVAAVVGALAVLETVGVIPGQFPEIGVQRAALGFGQPNGLGMYLALSLPFAVHARTISRTTLSRLAATIGLIAVVGGLAGTFSRGSWLSVLAGAIALLALGQWRFVLRLAGSAVIAALAMDVISGGAVRDTVFGILRDWSVAQRAALMLAGIRLFLEHPLIGAGPGSFGAELERLGALVPTLWDLKPTPHNAYIQVAAESGLIGLATFTALLVALLRRGLRSAREAAAGGNAIQTSLQRAALWSLAIACAEGMVEWPLSHGHAQIVVIAAAIACAASVSREGVGGSGSAARAHAGGPTVGPDTGVGATP